MMFFMRILGKGKIGSGMHKPFRKGIGMCEMHQTLSFFDRTPHIFLFSTMSEDVHMNEVDDEYEEEVVNYQPKSTTLQVAYLKVDHACHSRSRTRNGTRDH